MGSASAFLVGEDGRVLVGAPHSTRWAAYWGRSGSEALLVGGGWWVGWRAWAEAGWLKARVGEGGRRWAEVDGGGRGRAGEGPDGRRWAGTTAETERVTGSLRKDREEEKTKMRMRKGKREEKEVNGKKRIEKGERWGRREEER